MGRSKTYFPVCGFNNQTYPNDCTATCSGEDIDWDGECPCPPFRKICSKCLWMDLDPVCGSRRSYPNECAAKCDGSDKKCIAFYHILRTECCYWTNPACFHFQFAYKLLL